jgi:hypothetical protein
MNAKEFQKACVREIRKEIKWHRHAENSHEFIPMPSKQYQRGFEQGMRHAAYLIRNIPTKFQ